MNPPTRHKSNSPRRSQLAALLLASGAFLLLPAAGRAVISDDITTVAARVSSDYARTKQADGSFEPEPYAFGEGGYLRGTDRDDSIDKLKFVEIAKTIAGPLSRQGYLPARESKTTKLLIMVYWGNSTGINSLAGNTGLLTLRDSMAPDTPPPTVPPLPENPSAPSVPGAYVYTPKDPTLTESGGHQLAAESAMVMIAMQNRLRDQHTEQVAGLLGYETELGKFKGLQNIPMRSGREDIVDELEDGRYFVVLLAYDFQQVMKKKKYKWLWETRFSIRKRNHDFDQSLEAMAEEASRFFGRDSNGLRRESLREGYVKIDKLRFLGVEPEKAKSTKDAPDRTAPDK